LVVIFRRPKTGRGENLRHDRSRMPLLFSIAGRDSRALLLRAVRKYRRAVLISHVGSLPIELRGIVNLPENVEQAIVTDLLRIEGHLDGFGVPGRMAADLSIRGILRTPAGVTGDGVNDAGNAAEGIFDAPEATGRKGCSLRVHTLYNAAACRLDSFSASSRSSRARTSSRPSRRASSRSEPRLTPTTAGRGKRL
jgi:hypothetical protein